MKKYIRFKKLSSSDNIRLNTFHIENQGKVFELIREDEEYYHIKEHDYGFFKWRFEEFKLVNLPDELFTI